MSPTIIFERLGVAKAWTGWRKSESSRLSGHSVDGDVSEGLLAAPKVTGAGANER